MRIQPGCQVGMPIPSLMPLYNDILAAKTHNELMFTLTKYMDIPIEECVSALLFCHA